MTSTLPTTSGKCISAPHRNVTADEGAHSSCSCSLADGKSTVTPFASMLPAAAEEAIGPLGFGAIRAAEPSECPPLCTRSTVSMGRVVPLRPWPPQWHLRQRQESPVRVARREPPVPRRHVVVQQLLSHLRVEGWQLLTRQHVEDQQGLFFHGMLQQGA